MITKQAIDEALGETLRRHLVATLCTEVSVGLLDFPTSILTFLQATNLLVYMMALHHDVHMETDKISTANERKEVLSQLPLTAATPLNALVESLRGSVLLFSTLDLDFACS